MVMNIDLNDMFDMDDEDKLNEQFDEFMSNIDDLEEAKDVLNQMMEYEDEALDYWETVRHLRCKVQRRIKSLKKEDIYKYIGKCFVFTIGYSKYSGVRYFKIIDINIIECDVVARCLTLNRENLTSKNSNMGIEIKNMRLWNYVGVDNIMVIDYTDEISEDDFYEKLEYWKNEMFKNENMDA